MNILITGGASGLGNAITRKLAEDINNFVYFTYNASQSNAGEITKEFSNSLSIKCDFSNSDEVNSLAEKLDQFKLDVLINNAYHGSYLKSHFHKTAPDDFLISFNINIIPVIKIAQSAINYFRKNKSGKIITILTTALIETPSIGSSVYVSTKAYLKQLTKMWAVENAKFNITSNSISPSFLLTNLTKNIDERVIDQIRQNHPMQKLLTVDEVADNVKLMTNALYKKNGFDLILGSTASIL